jgi:hypothetical protein
VKNRKGIHKPVGGGGGGLSVPRMLPRENLKI